MSFEDMCECGTTTVDGLDSLSKILVRKTSTTMIIHRTSLTALNSHQAHTCHAGGPDYTCSLSTSSHF